MKDVSPNAIRSFALIGHQGCGKTSLAEAMLFNTKALSKLGTVDGASTALDFEPDEQERGGSVGASFASCEYNGRRLHIVDTPGDGSFTHEARSALQAADSAVLVVSAPDGVEVETERTWDYAKEQGLPVVVFVNKMDRDRADAAKVLTELEATLGIKPVRLALPIGSAESFSGYVDLLRQQAYEFVTDGSGKVTKCEIPADLADAVEEAREALVEAAAEGDDDLIEKYLETLELSDEEIFRGLELGIRHGAILPVLFGSATKNEGINRLLDITAVMPNASQRDPRKDSEGKDIIADPDGAFAALVIKTLIDPYAGMISVARVLRGTLTDDTDATNTTQDEHERLGHGQWLLGKKLTPVKTAVAGDIVAFVKLKHTETGDTLADTATPLRSAWLDFPRGMVTVLVKPASKSDEDKVKSCLQRIIQEDPCLLLGSDELTHDITISGTGMIHIDTNLKRMNRKYGVGVETAVPPVPYRESILGTTEVEGKHKKQSGGRGQFGVCYLRMEPNPGKGFEFVNAIVGGAIPKQYIPAVEKGLIEAMGRGVLAGYPIVDVKITCYDGKFHAVDSSEAAFKMAGSKGFKAGFMKCKPVLLEPIMDMTIRVPQDNVGDIMGDVSGRRGKVLNTDYGDRWATVQAHVPKSELADYAPTIGSITQGKGQFEWELFGYERVPNELQHKVVDASDRKLVDDDD